MFSRSGFFNLAGKMHWMSCEFLMVSGLPVSNISDIGEKINIDNFLLQCIVDSASRSIFF